MKRFRLLPRNLASRPRASIEAGMPEALVFVALIIGAAIALSSALVA